MHKTVKLKELRDLPVIAEEYQNSCYACLKPVYIIHFISLSFNFFSNIKL